MVPLKLPLLITTSTFHASSVFTTALHFLMFPVTLLHINQWYVECLDMSRVISVIDAIAKRKPYLGGNTGFTIYSTTIRPDILMF